MGRTIAVMTTGLVLLVVGACSSSSTESPPANVDADAGAEGGGAITAEQFCKDVWTKLCAGRQKCQPYAFGDWSHGDMNDCITRQTDACIAGTKGATIT